MIAWRVWIAVLVMLLAYENPALAHGNGIGLLDCSGSVSTFPVPVHQYLTYVAVQTWPDAPDELRENARRPDYTSSLNAVCLAKYDAGDNIVIGSGEEDQAWNPVYCPLHCPVPFMPTKRDPKGNGWLEHFWDPSDPSPEPAKGLSGYYNLGLLFNGVQYDSAWTRAYGLWRRALQLYQAVSTRGEAYWYLGRVAHLLQDMTVPAHVHLIAHDPVAGTKIRLTPCIGHLSPICLEYDKDSFEDYVGDHPELLKNMETDKRLGKHVYKYEDLPGISAQQRFSWEEVDPLMKLDAKGSRLFRLFWYTAMKTQYFASGKGNTQAIGSVGTYRTLDGSPRQLKPSLWDTDATTPLETPDQTAQYPEKVAAALIPHAIKATAGLFRLFFDETNPKERPLVVSSLEIRDEKGKLLREGDMVESGTNLNAKFTLENRGTKQLDIVAVTAAGRLYEKCLPLPEGCPDFAPILAENRSLAPNASISYEGKLTLKRTGNYAFSVSYQKPDGTWVTSVPPLDGLRNALRINSATPMVVPPSLPREPGQPPVGTSPVPQKLKQPPVKLVAFYGSNKIIIESTEIIQSDLWCALRATIRNVTGNMVRVMLFFNAFDAGGNGIAGAGLQSSQPPRSRVETDGPFADLRKQGMLTGMTIMKSCSGISSIELDTAMSNVQ